ncbi:Sorting nexin-8-like protein [Operophtera brumata]|uniref:Sorting nexin-8-like protein n=1 Tax=Operophtera brumata TaxID=104452 RepID=A0A0L7L2U4_OPEBR|nr:Sorting nexin-8-like protein [Operophtera brumata]
MFGLLDYSEKVIVNMSTLDVVTYAELESTDVLSVELVPERKGLIIKHCEYYVSSRRHGTTVTRRYNDFAQLAVCRLPPKRVVVGGGSEDFLQRRREALQRWLTLTARHPVLAHDADLRAFLCEAALKLDRPRHDEFLLAGTTELYRRREALQRWLTLTARHPVLAHDADLRAFLCEAALKLDRPRHDEFLLAGTTELYDEASTEEMESAFHLEQEELRLLQLGLTRLAQIFERGRYHATSAGHASRAATVPCESRVAACSKDPNSQGKVKFLSASSEAAYSTYRADKHYQLSVQPRLIETQTSAESLKSDISHYFSALKQKVFFKLRYLHEPLKQDGMT